MALIAVCAAADAPAADVPIAAATAAESQRFAAFVDASYERLLDANPSLATAQGDRRGDERWEDQSDRGLAADAALARRELAAARAFRSEVLEPRARLQQRIFVAQQSLLLERDRWRNHLYPLNQIVGPHVDVPRVLASQPVEDLAGAQAWLRRLAAVKPHMEGLVQRLEAQAAAGVHLPKSVYPILIAQARNLLSGAPQQDAGEGPILADFARKLAALPIEPTQRERLLAQARRTLRQDVEPGYRRLVARLEAHAARAAVDGGAWQLPDGAAFYAFLLRQFTTTELDAEAVHALGLAEVERTHREMTTLMRQLGWSGELRGFLQQTRSDPRFFLADDEAGRAAYLARARGIVAAMQSRLPEAFLKPPALPLEIRATEPYRAAGAPGGYYEPGTPDGSRPGIVYLNLLKLDSRPLYDLEALLYHEAVPGHHLQVSSILSDPTIPRLRKVNRWWQDTAFVEGWALYTERLAREMGFYQDPYADFGRLAGELWRATRLVVDTGLHAKRWTREQSIRYLDDNTPSPHAANEQAVDRYLAVPGQATAFTVGMLRIVAERERARAALGTRFDLREFHAAVLENGYVPLWALQENVDRWIAARGVPLAACGRPGAPTDPCLAESYWRRSAARGRQAARVQYLRYTLQGKFQRCAGVTSDDQLLEDFGTALTQKLPAPATGGTPAPAAILSGAAPAAAVPAPSPAPLPRTVDASARAAWSRCAASRGVAADQPLRLRRFGETREAIERLQSLILAGEKTMTATSRWIYDADAMQRPVEGGWSMLLDADGRPAAVLRTTAVKLLPFSAVTGSDSQYEGKPVRPITVWREVHQRYFERMLKPLGRAWSPDMPVALERFEVACRA